MKEGTSPVIAKAVSQMVVTPVKSASDESNSNVKQTIPNESRKRTSTPHSSKKRILSFSY